MNIGSIKQNDAGIFVGKIATLTIAMTIALREVQSSNPAPKYEVLALCLAGGVRVGALFELFSNGTGESFLNGKIEDPSLAAPLYISAFRQEDILQPRLVAPDPPPRSCSRSRYEDR